MAEEQGFWGGAWDALGGAASSTGAYTRANPDKTAIALDMLGKGFDPENPFAGVGTALGKSSLAAKAETAGAARSKDMFQQLLAALTPGDKPGPTSFTAALDKEGRGVGYSINGIEGIETPTRLPGAAKMEAEIGSAGDFAARFGGGS